MLIETGSSQDLYTVRTQAQWT